VALSEVDEFLALDWRLAAGLGPIAWPHVERARAAGWLRLSDPGLSLLASKEDYWLVLDQSMAGMRRCAVSADVGIGSAQTHAEFCNNLAAKVWFFPDTPEEQAASQRQAAIEADILSAFEREVGNLSWRGGVPPHLLRCALGDAVGDRIPPPAVDVIFRSSLARLVRSRGMELHCLHRICAVFWLLNAPTATPIHCPPLPPKHAPWRGRPS
jgi:hypothetical protein